MSTRKYSHDNLGTVVEDGFPRPEIGMGSGLGGVGADSRSLFFSSVGMEGCGGSVLFGSSSV